MMKKLTKTKVDLSNAVFNKIGYTKKFSNELVEDTFNLIKEKLKAGQGVKIYGFGKFVLNDKKSRLGRDPQTGEEIQIPSRRSLSFRPSFVLRDRFKD